MRTWDDINRMAAEDYKIGLDAHYPSLAKLINDNNCKAVVEIGTAYGGSAGYISRHTGLENLYSIDPYQYYGSDLGCQMPGLECQEDYDKLYIMANFSLSHYNPSGTLYRFHQIRMKSKDAIQYFKLTYPILPPVDLVFIDGEHTKENVLWECENYSQIIRSGGILCGHDWGVFAEVNEAVWEFSRKISQQPKVLNGNVWFFNI